MEKIEYPPPKHLSERSKKLWRDVVPRRARSPERLTLVQTALEALDRAEVARVKVEAEGLTCTTKTTGAVHLNPLIRIEREARQLFLRCWTDLALHWSQEIDGRIYNED